jgi:excisionase family DNA binding protein/PAS domain S-box-containing protein
VRQLIRRLQEPVIGCDRDLGIVTVSAATERLFGYSIGELVGQHYSVIRSVEPELHAQRERRVLERGSYDGDARMFDADGQVVDITVRVVAVHIVDCGIEYLSVIRPVADAADFGAATRIGRLYTLDEAAVLLRKSTRTVRRMLAAGTLGGQKVGGTWRIPRSELERLTRVADTG